MTSGGGITAPASGAVKTGSSPLIIKLVQVEQLPPGLSSSKTPVQIEAVVAEIRAATSEIVLATQLGEIVIKTTVQIPPGTKVIVELAAGDPPELAALKLAPTELALLPKIPELEKPAQALPPPPPELEIPAVLIETKNPSVILPPVTAPVLPLDVEKAVALLKDFLLTGETTPVTPAVHLKIVDGLTPQFPLKIELTPETKIIPTPQILKVALAIKTIIETVKTIAPEKAPSLLTSPLPLAEKTVETPFENAFDLNIGELVSARIHARIASAQIGSAPLSAPLPAPLIKGTISSFLNILTTEKTPERAPVLPQPSSGDLKVAQVKILLVLPPNPTPVKIHTALKTLLPVEEKSVLDIAKSLGKTPTGQILLETAKGYMILQTTAHAIPKGSIVITQTTPMPQGLNAPISFFPQTDLAGITLPEFNPLISRDWPAMEEALRVLTGHSAAAAQILRNTLPTPTPRLVPTALFFLAALKGGIIENWLGDKNISALKEAGHQKLADRLASDFSKMAGQAGETLASDWKAISMPILHDDQVSKLMFFVRHQDPDTGGKETNGKRQTRFILNLNLSRIGDMQLDGLFKQGQLDVVLRTHNALTKTMQNELTQKYSNAMEQTRLTGLIRFQTKGWVEPPQAASFKTAGVVA